MRNLVYTENKPGEWTLVTPEMLADHMKDMGVVRGGDIRLAMDDFIRPLDTSKLSCREVISGLWEFTDDRGFHFRLTAEAYRDFTRRGGRVRSAEDRNRYLKFGPYDKLRRLIIVQDDRGATFQFEPFAVFHGIHAPIPRRGVLRAPLWDSASKQQRGALMAQKKTTDTETPIEQTQPKLALYFRVNDLPQELNQKQTVEHVTKLLTLGAANVTISRFIRDETSERHAHSRY
jgi:hypothetical protein